MLNMFSNYEPFHRIILMRLFLTDSEQDEVESNQLPKTSLSNIEKVLINVKSKDLEDSLNLFMTGQYEAAIANSINCLEDTLNPESQKYHTILSNKKLGRDTAALNYFTELVALERSLKGKDLKVKDTVLLEEFEKERETIGMKISVEEENEALLKQSCNNEVWFHYVPLDGESVMIPLPAEKRLTWNRVKKELMGQLGIHSSLRTCDLYVEKAPQGFQKIQNIEEQVDCSNTIYKVTLSKVPPTF